jgi:hypothetical protein
MYWMGSRSCLGQRHWFVEYVVAASGKGGENWMRIFQDVCYIMRSGKVFSHWASLCEKYRHNTRTEIFSFFILYGPCQQYRLVSNDVMITE